MFGRRAKAEPPSTIPETRITKEVKDLEESGDSGVSAAPISPTDPLVWRGTIDGPSDSVYEGGVFHIEIILPTSYPFTPPKMRFDTKVWHPNISSQTGAICLDILKDQWSPALTIRTALQSLQALLSAPVPDDPQDAVVAEMYIKQFPVFEETAREWTRRYAIPGSVDEAAISSLVEMGFDRARVIAALRDTNNDQEQALNVLLG